MLTQNLVFPVLSYRSSQLELRLQIDALLSELDKISSEQQTAVPLEPYTKKLVDAQQKISIVGNILQTTQVTVIKKFVMCSVICILWTLVL